MTNTKYRLISEDYKEIGGKKLYRIEALKDFGDVKAGSLGGYIESEDNLSRDGNAWVGGNAWVSDNSWVDGNARVSGNARVNSYARIGENAVVCNNESWLIVGPIGSRDDFTTFVATADGEIHVSCGCFSGDIDEFEKAVEKTHAGTKHEKDYKLAIELAKSRIVTAEVNEDEV